MAGDFAVGLVDHKAIVLGGMALLVAVLGLVIIIVASGGWQLLGIPLLVLGIIGVIAVIALRAAATRGIRKLSGPSPR